MYIKKNNKKNNRFNIKFKKKFFYKKKNKRFKKIKNKKLNKLKKKNNNILNNKINKKKNKKYNKYKNLKKKILINRKIGNKIKTRPPIITIMGHVNHGKTSLINYIKSSNKKIKEYGNITQNINTYNIKTKLGKLTILDTPGHSTFIDMRKRGINISDIIILLIAIDDGIMPQTLEVIKYANKNHVPIIITINKIDKINYLHNIKKIKEEIYKYNLIYKNIQFSKIFIKISTKNKIGIKKLIKYIFIKSKSINLNTIYNGMASGIILDSRINKNIGTITKILIKKGTLKTGNIILCNETYGKIKCILNNKKKIKKATPSMIIEILGLSNIPKLGEKFIIVNNKKLAKKISLLKYKKNKQKKLEKIKKKQINNFLLKKNKINKLNIIIKTNLLSIVKTIKNTITKQISKNIKIIYKGIGNINENDLIFAKTTNSIIFSFNVKKNNSIKNNNKYNIKIYYFSLIHKLIKKIKKIYKLKFNKKNNENNIIIGEAIIQNIFKFKKLDSIAGCKVIKGFININNIIQIIRNNKKIYEGKIKSIQKFKNKINIVYKNSECGIHINNFNKIKIGDKIISIK